MGDHESIRDDILRAISEWPGSAKFEEAINSIYEELYECISNHIEDRFPDDEDLKCPVPELMGTKPLVLYFGNEADREEMISVVKQVMPNAVTKKL